MVANWLEQLQHLEAMQIQLQLLQVAAGDITELALLTTGDAEIGYQTGTGAPGIGEEENRLLHRWLLLAELR